MKLVITVEQFDPAKGYLEFYLAKELAKLGHKVWIFTFGWSKSVLRTMLEGGFEVVSIPHQAVVGKYHIPSLRGIAYLTRFARTEKPELIHCQPLFSPLSLVFMTFRKLFDYKIVGSLVTQEFSTVNTATKLMYCFAKAVTKKYANPASAVIYAKTRGLARMLVESFGVEGSKIQIIPLGADPDLFRFDATARKQIRNRLGIQKDDVAVVYSGKITPSKNIELLINALTPIIVTNPEVKLIIIGEGEPSYVTHLRKALSNRGIVENVVFQPWVHRTKLGAFYSASDIAVWPGRSSISIVEAASTGLPVIMSEPSVESYAVSYENGLSFERGNLADLRRCLKVLIEDSGLRKKMGHRSRLLVEKELNWRNIAYQYLDSYSCALM